MDAYEQSIYISIEFDIQRGRAWRAEIANAQACGEELYYDMSEPKLVGLSDGPVLIGQWRRRKKANDSQPAPTTPTQED